MSLAQVYALVCLFWFITEFVGIRIAGGIRAQGLDRASLGAIWITLLLSILTASIVQKLGPGDWHEHKRVLLAAATLLVVVGGAIRLTAILTLKKFFTVRVTILSDHRLIRRGLYAHVRHPSYLGALIGFFGVGLGMCNWLSLLIVFLPILGAFLYRIRVEESALRQRFGREYEVYCRSTKRLVPWLY
ncbi:MAG TPA: isoprenylcysteine carboxylmethyltransferase family protein [Verrucomicrobiae bacterium]|nr:isoprenylcysteine carboxylmethyltransferase family protein [Verrucomicrobiae bacterium]